MPEEKPVLTPYQEALAKKRARDDKMLKEAGEELRRRMADEDARKPKNKKRKLLMGLMTDNPPKKK